MSKNKERYQRSFQTLHLSEDFPERLEERLADEREGTKMTTSAFHGFGRIAAAITICAVTFGVGGICYASDVGGIRTKLEVWMNGEKSEIVAEEDGMGYSWTDEDGNEYGFGGVALDENGNELPLCAEELARSMNNEASLRPEGGKTMLYYKNLAVDVTDLITAEGKLNVHISDPLNPYTYFSFVDIDGGSYGCSSSDMPEGNGEYIELDASGLTEEGTAAKDRDENTTYGVYTISDEE